MPSLTEALFAFGAGDRVVGVTKYCVEPVEAHDRPIVDGTKTPAIESLLSLGPDLVIASQEENRREDVEAIESAGTPVFLTLPTTVRQARDMLADFAAVTGCLDGAARCLEEIDSTVAEMEARTEGHSACVFCPIWRRPYMSIGVGTYAHDLLGLCGGVNVFGDRDGRYPTVSIEDIVAADPDVVLLPDEPYPFAPKHRDELAALPIAAARNGRIHFCDGKDLTWYGPRTAGALCRIEALVHP